MPNATQNTISRYDKCMRRHFPFIYAFCLDAIAFFETGHRIYLEAKNPPPSPIDKVKINPRHVPATGKQESPLKKGMHWVLPVINIQLEKV